jgi:hypothetical protein
MLLLTGGIFYAVGSIVEAIFTDDKKDDKDKPPDR